MCVRLVALMWAGPQPHSLAFFPVPLLSSTAVEVKGRELEIEGEKPVDSTCISSRKHPIHFQMFIYSGMTLCEMYQTQDLEYRTLKKGYFFVVSGCKKSCCCVIFNGWVRRSPHSAESIEERCETLLRSLLSFYYVQEILMRE